MEIKKYVSGDFETNTYVVTINKKSIVIDPTLDFEEIYDDICKNYNVVGVLITHAHIDHIDGLIFFKNKPIYIPRLEFEHINDGGYTLYGYYMLDLPFDLNEYNVHLLDDGDIIEVLDEKIKVMTTKGHTQGSVVYIFEDSKCIFSGDTLFKMSVGRTDFKSGNEEDILKSILKIIDTYDGYKIYPGHNDETTVEFEKMNNPYYKYAKSKGI